MRTNHFYNHDRYRNQINGYRPTFGDEKQIEANRLHLQKVNRERPVCEADYLGESVFFRFSCLMNKCRVDLRFSMEVEDFNWYEGKEQSFSCHCCGQAYTIQYDFAMGVGLYFGKEEGL